MRVLNLTWGPLECYGGIETHISNLSQALELAGVMCETMVLPSMNHLHLRRSDVKSRLPLLQFHERLTEVIAERSIDVVHSNNIHRIHAHGIPEAIMEVVKRTAKVHVTTIHDVGGPPPSSELLWRISQVLGSARCVVTSEYTCSAFAAIYNIMPAAIIPPALDLAAFPVFGNREPHTIAYPGRLTPGKGAREAILLTGQLSESYGPITLILSDPGQRCYGDTDEYVSMLRTAAALFKNLTLDFLPQGASVQDMYRRASVTLCMPMAPEGFGLTPLESLATGTPVVAAPNGGMTWVNGLPGVAAFPDRSAISISTAIVEILENWCDWHKRVCGFRALLLERFDLRRVAEQYMSLYSGPQNDIGAA